MKYQIGRATISYLDGGEASLSFGHAAVAAEQELDATADVTEALLPVSIEVIAPRDQLGQLRMDRLLSSLDENGLNYSFDEDSDALLVNINALDEPIFTQRPYTVRLLFDGDQSVVGVQLAKRGPAS